MDETPIMFDNVKGITIEKVGSKEVNFEETLNESWGDSLNDSWYKSDVEMVMDPLVDLL